MRAGSLPFTVLQLAVIAGPVALGLREGWRLNGGNVDATGFLNRAAAYGTRESFIAVALLMLFNLVLLQLAAEAISRKGPDPELVGHEQEEELTAEWSGAMRGMLNWLVLTMHVAMASMAMGTTIGRLEGYVMLRVVMWPLVGASLLLTAVIVPRFWIRRLRKISERVEQAVGRTVDRSRWRLMGALYVAPEDPRMWVLSRRGLGYTLNWGRKSAWLLVLSMVAAVIGVLVLSPQIAATYTWATGGGGGGGAEVYPE